MKKKVYVLQKNMCSITRPKHYFDTVEEVLEFCEYVGYKIYKTPKQYFEHESEECDEEITEYPWQMTKKQIKEFESGKRLLEIIGVYDIKYRVLNESEGIETYLSDVVELYNSDYDLRYEEIKEDEEGIE